MISGVASTAEPLRNGIALPCGTRILVGEALQRLKELPDESVHCVITSPPYWGLRSYGGQEGMIGLEPTLAEHIENLLSVFREVKRALRHDGTLWLNYGDAYAGSGRGNKSESLQNRNKGSVAVPEHQPGWKTHFKPKDLMLLPARVAIALQDDGWFLRSEIIWHKCLAADTLLCAQTQDGIGAFRLDDLAQISPDEVSLWTGSKWTAVTSWATAAPQQVGFEITLGGGEVITCTADHRWPTTRGLVHASALQIGDAIRTCELPDGMGSAGTHSGKNEMVVSARPSSATEFFDVSVADPPHLFALASGVLTHNSNAMPESVVDRPTSAHEQVFLFSKGPRYYYDAAAVRTQGSPNTHARRKDGQRKPRKGTEPNDNRTGSWAETRTIEEQAEIGSNLRDVWKIAIQPFTGAHFATFPLALCEPPVKAGTCEHGVCSECGSPWRRVHEETGHQNQREPAHAPGNTPTKVDSTGWMPTTRATDGWTPDCSCNAAREAAVVLDPFGGAGTVALVANLLHRSAVLIEINPEYARMSKERIEDEMPLFASVAVEA